MNFIELIASIENDPRWVDGDGGVFLVLEAPASEETRACGGDTGLRIHLRQARQGYVLELQTFRDGRSKRGEQVVQHAWAVKYLPDATDPKAAPVRWDTTRTSSDHAVVVQRLWSRIHARFDDNRAGLAADALSALPHGFDRTFDRTDITKADQAWLAVRTCDVGPHRLRITFRRDAYAAQSYGRCERWSGTSWEPVEHLPLELCGEEAAAVSYSLPRERVEAGLLSALNVLHARAVAFFTTL